MIRSLSRYELIFALNLHVPPFRVRAFCQHVVGRLNPIVSDLSSLAFGLTWGSHPLVSSVSGVSEKRKVCWRAFLQSARLYRRILYGGGKKTWMWLNELLVLVTVRCNTPCPLPLEIIVSHNWPILYRWPPLEHNSFPPVKIQTRGCDLIHQHSPHDFYQDGPPSHWTELRVSAPRWACHTGQTFTLIDFPSHFLKVVPPACAFKEALGRVLSGQGPRRGDGEREQCSGSAAVARWSTGS